MDLNVNKSDSKDLNKEPENEKSAAPEEFNSTTGYFVEEDGKRIAKWIGKDGKQHEKII